MSHLEMLINKLVINIIVVQCLISSFLAIMSFSWLTGSHTDWWNDIFTFLSPKHSPTEEEKAAIQKSNDAAPDYKLSTLSFFTYFLLLNTLLPISLQVSLEFVKVFQAYFINNDALMFSWDRCKLVDCKTVSIVEDVGQVSYIFSDKTGTLTRNVMEFKYMLVGNEFYGDINNFEQTGKDEGEVLQFNKLRTTVRRKSYIDPNLEMKSTMWRCKNFS